MLKKIIFVVFLSLTPFVSFALTYSTSTSAVNSARVISNYPTTNFQNALTVTASTSASVRKGLVQFNIPSLPSGY